QCTGWYIPLLLLNLNFEPRLLMNHLKLLPTFAVVDDEPDYRELIQASFANCSCIVEGLGSLDELRKRIKTQRFEVVIVDVYLGSERGLNVIPYLLSHAPQTKIVVMTAFGTIDLAVEAMKQGASSFVVKTSDPRQIAQEVMGLIAQSDQDSHDSDPFHEYG